MNYCEIKQKMNETDSMGLWDDKELIFTAADMHKMIEVQDAKTRAFYKKQISRMMTESEIFLEFEKRAEALKLKIFKLREEEPEDKDLKLFYESKLFECRMMQGLFQRLFTHKYLEEEEVDEIYPKRS